MSDFGDALDALCLCKLMNVDPADEFGKEAATEAANVVSATLYAREKDTPGKTWWHAEAMHPAIFRALRMSKDDDGSIFAAVPFRLARIDGRARILVAF